MCYVSCGTEGCYAANHALLPAPERYHEVRKRADSANWIRRQGEHIMKLRRVGGGVYKLARRSDADNVLKSTWVYARKLRAHKIDGLPEDSARVAAGGYGQIHGVDYGETYCPTMPQESYKINEAEAIGDPSVIYVKKLICQEPTTRASPNDVNSWSSRLAWEKHPSHTMLLF